MYRDVLTGAAVAARWNWSGTARWCCGRPRRDRAVRGRRRAAPRRAAGERGEGCGGDEGSAGAGPVHGTWEAEPAARWEDAFLSGNGRHGALVFGGPGDERVVVTHHCLVTPVPPADTLPPRLADRLPDLQDRLLAGDTAAADAFTDGRGLRWVVRSTRRSRSGCGRRRRATRGYRREVDFATGVVRARCRGRDSRVFVSRADDVAVRHPRARRSGRRWL